MNLDGFTASKDTDVSAIGDSAADFLDMEIGLWLNLPENTLTEKPLRYTG